MLLEAMRPRDTGYRMQAIARAEAMRGKRGTAGQRAQALPMHEPGQERLARADAPRPERASGGGRPRRSRIAASRSAIHMSAAAGR